MQSLKNKFIKILMAVIMMFASTATVFSTATVTVAASEDCKVVTLYSKKDWVSHTDLIDTSFTSSNASFVNSEGINVTITAFGELNNPKRTNYSTMIGNQRTESISTGAEQVFIINFGTSIKLSQLTSKIYAVKNDGTYAKYHIYKDSWYTAQSGFTMGTEIASGTGTSKTFTFNDVEVNSLMIRFDDVSSISKYVINGFQIDKYKVYQHIEWTETYIEGAETKIEEYCLTGGQFKPNGTGNKWVTEANTSFYAKASSIFTYQPEFVSNSFVWDWNKTSSYSAGSMPWDVRNYDSTNAYNIAGFVNIYGSMYQAVGADGSKYISNSNGSLFAVYTIEQRYWIPYGSIDKQGWSSNDVGWCGDVTGQGGVSACTKHDGHTSNARYNTFDVSASYYRKVSEDKQKVSSTKYTLIEYDTNYNEIKRTSLGTVTGDKEFYNYFNETGIYKIQADVQDQAGNKLTRTSDYFLIDKEKPYGVFTMIEDDGTHPDKVKMQLSAADDHSGVDKWRYAISYDDGVTYNAFSNYYSANETADILYNKDDYITVKIESVDKVGNTSIDSYKSPGRPVIVAEDRYFFVGSTITEDMLLEKVKAMSTLEGNISSKATIVDTDINPYIEGIYDITYEITDKYGLSSMATAKIHIVGDSAEPQTVQRIRAISPKFYCIGEETGCIDPNSKWTIEHGPGDHPYGNNDLYNELNDTMNKDVNDENSIQIWEFSAEDVQAAKDFIRSNSPSQESNKEFIEQFSSNRTK